MGLLAFFNPKKKKRPPGGQVGGVRREGVSLLAKQPATILVDVATANFLAYVGNEAYRHGDYPQALSYHAQALEMNSQLGRQEEIADGLSSLGEIHAIQGDHPQALTYYSQALALARQLGYQEGSGKVLTNMGNIYNTQGDYAQALSHYQQALALARQLGHQRGLAICLNNIGLVYTAQGDYAQALSHYQQALALARAVGHQKGIGDCLGNIGRIYTMQGDYAQALSHYQQALALARQLGHQAQIAINLSHIGNIYRLQGDSSQALSHYHQALEINCQLRRLQGMAVCLLHLSVIYEAQGNAPPALSCLTQALAISRRLNAQEMVASCLANLGNIYKTQGDYAQAWTHYEQALALARQLGHQEGIAVGLHNMATIYQLQGDFSQALSHYGQALEIDRQLGHLEGIARCLANMGHSSLLQGHLAPAYHFLVEAIAVVEQLRQQVAGSRQQQIGLFERFLDPYFTLIEGVLWPQADYEQALEYVERAKARTLVELMAEQDLLPTAAVPPALLQAYQRQRRRQREIDVWLEHHGSQQVQRVVAQRAERQEVARELGSLLEQISAYDPDFTATVRVEPIRLQDLQEALPDVHTALVELFLGQEQTLAFLVSKVEGVIGVEVADCPPAAVRALAERWSTEYAEFRERRRSLEAWRQCMDEVLRELYRRLFVPIQQARPGPVRRLIFVPHRHFHLFPLHAMYREEKGQRVYLLEEYEEVSYAPSAALWLRCQQRRRPAPRRLVAVENPTGDLPFAEVEVRAIAPLFAERRILGPKQEKPATKAVFLEEATHAHVVLCTGHSRSGALRAASIQLSAAQQLTLLDQFCHLTLPECFLWDSDTCETALHYPTPADEWITLASAPLYAGASTVWSTLWAVDDFATAQLKQRAYANLLQRGMNKVQALNEAQRWFLRGEFPASEEAPLGTEQARFALQQEVQRVRPEGPQLAAKHRHPFYWAPFMASGAT